MVADVVTLILTPGSKTYLPKCPSIGRLMKEDIRLFHGASVSTTERSDGAALNQRESAGISQTMCSTPPKEGASSSVPAAAGDVKLTKESQEYE